MPQKQRHRRESPSPDVLFDVLRHPHRRTVVRVLLAQDGVCPLDDLTSAIAGEDDEARRSAELGLVHSHLPRLVDAGFVEYDERSRDVVGMPALAAAEPHLRLVSEAGGPERLAAEDDPDG